MTQDSLLNVAAISASYNIILQILLRIATFVLNAFVLRFVTKDVLGVINVRLLLLYTTTQFLSREAFRRACLGNVNNQNWKQIINLVWLTVPLSALCGMILRLIWLHSIEQPDIQIVKDYSIGVNTVLVCVVLEMLSEPLYIIGQAFQFIKLKVIIEGIYLSVRSVIMALLIVYFSDQGILVFCIAQTFSSVVYTTLYYVYFYTYINNNQTSNFPFKSITEFLPQWGSYNQCEQWSRVKLIWGFTKQTFLKQILTEGEKYVMTLFAALSFAEQGIYDVVNNLGSLAARFIFQPIEESGYIFFSQTLKRGVNINEQPDAKMSALVVKNLLKLMVLLGLIILTFGYSYSKLLLLLYGGSSLSSSLALQLLRWHCVYVLFIAINGVTECFVFAAMGLQDINRYNKIMMLLSISFLSASYYLTAWCGSVGFILANCFNMFIRISHSVYFIHKFFYGTIHQPLRGLLPHPVVLGAFGASFFITSFSESYYCCDKGFIFYLIHVCIGICCLCILLGIIYIFEKSLMQFVKQQIESKKKR